MAEPHRLAGGARRLLIPVEGHREPGLRGQAQTGGAS